MTEKEELMYHIMSKLSQNDLPIVYKGALITKLILKEHGFCELERYTKDIDANWIGKKPSMVELESTIDSLVKSLDKGLKALSYREYGESKSAGINIIDTQDNSIVTKMDIDIKPLLTSQSYWYGDMRFKGTTVDHIICDKISSLSSDKVFRRVKDMVDIYALSKCVTIRTKDISNIAAFNKRNIDSFDKFLNHTVLIEHAYNKLQGINGKPEFGTIYSHVKGFIEPFREKNQTNMIWNSKKEAWNELKTKEQLHNEKQAHKVRERNEPEL